MNIKSCEWASAAKASEPPGPKRSKGLSVNKPLSIVRSRKKSKDVLLNNQQPMSISTQMENPEIWGRSLTPNGDQCGCPCHNPGMYSTSREAKAAFMILIKIDYTSMLLDPFRGSCKICGNLPSPDNPPSLCTPIMVSSLLRRTQAEPFDILPTESSTQIIKLIHHCKLFRFLDSLLRSHTSTH